MEYIHQMINSEKLAEIFDLPTSLMGKTVEVIILPVSIRDKKPDVKKNLHSVRLNNMPIRH